MKKNVLICMVSVVCIAAAGCGNTNGAAVTETLEPENKAEAADAYQVNMQEYSSGENSSIIYPQISGWDDEEKQAEWNRYFLNEVETMAADLTEKDSMDISYEVMEQTEDILSVICRIYMDYEGAAHPSQGMTSCNINMKTGERLGLNDLADPKEVADVILNTSDYTVVEGGELTMQDILEYNLSAPEGEISEEILASSFSHFDGAYEDYGEGELFGKSYLENGRLCLIFEVNHAMGDFVAIQLAGIHLK